jgi:hypothetical protein
VTGEVVIRMRRFHRARIAVAATFCFAKFFCLSLDDLLLLMCGRSSNCCSRIASSRASNSCPGSGWVSSVVRSISRGPLSSAECLLHTDDDTSRQPHG